LYSLKFGLTDIKQRDIRLIYSGNRKYSILGGLNTLDSLHISLIKTFYNFVTNIAGKNDNGLS